MTSDHPRGGKDGSPRKGQDKREQIKRQRNHPEKGDGRDIGRQVHRHPQHQARRNERQGHPVQPLSDLQRMPSSPPARNPRRPGRLARDPARSPSRRPGTRRRTIHTPRPRPRPPAGVIRRRQGPRRVQGDGDRQHEQREQDQHGVHDRLAPYPKPRRRHMRIGITTQQGRPKAMFVGSDNTDTCAHHPDRLPLMFEQTHDPARLKWFRYRTGGPAPVVIVGLIVTTVNGPRTTDNPVSTFRSAAWMGITEARHEKFTPVWSGRLTGILGKGLDRNVHFWQHHVKHYSVTCCGYYSRNFRDY